MTDRPKLLANSYLDHIRLAIEAGDGDAPFRDFFDNWNAYRLEVDHHRSRGGRPRWFNNPSALSHSKMLVALDFRSSGAAEIMTRAQADPKTYLERYKMQSREVKLLVDHAVPIKQIKGMLFEIKRAKTGELSRDDIEGALVRWYRLGLITHAENLRLRRAGLDSCMPSDWDGNDPFMRYREVGIVSCSSSSTTMPQDLVQLST